MTKIIFGVVVLALTGGLCACGQPRTARPPLQAYVPMLTRALQAPDPATRCRAAQGLARIGDAARPALPALQGALCDNDPHVRRAAGLAVRRLLGQADDGIDERS